ncbi:hypothetical protein QBC42DRAFT_324214 [Cladorrhinum samala]|uniref:Uncharacterized protein n=1 Tax=Cladorrhinum samala TaxID=585594 RepID=A0AAV9HTQ7_9PEZI|nr:hypothetical protein QBC42DRAFT_324214 [Cladorrhinum samala]
MFVSVQPGAGPPLFPFFLLEPTQSRLICQRPFPKPIIKLPAAPSSPLPGADHVSQQQQQQQQQRRQQQQQQYGALWHSATAESRNFFFIYGVIYPRTPSKPPSGGDGTFFGGQSATNQLLQISNQQPRRETTNNLVHVIHTCRHVIMNKAASTHQVVIVINGGSVSVTLGQIGRPGTVVYNRVGGGKKRARRGKRGNARTTPSALRRTAARLEAATQAPVASTTNTETPVAPTTNTETPVASTTTTETPVACS